LQGEGRENSACSALGSYCELPPTQPLAQKQPPQGNALLPQLLGTGHPRPKAFSSHCTQSSSEPPQQLRALHQHWRTTPHAACSSFPGQEAEGPGRSHSHTSAFSNSLFSHGDYKTFKTSRPCFHKEMDQPCLFTSRWHHAAFLLQNAPRGFPELRNGPRAQSCGGLTEQQPRSLHPSTSCGGLTGSNGGPNGDGAAHTWRCCDWESLKQDEVSTRAPRTVPSAADGRADHGAAATRPASLAASRKHSGLPYCCLQPWELRATQLGLCLSGQRAARFKEMTNTEALMLLPAPLRLCYQCKVRACKLGKRSFSCNGKKSTRR